VNIIDLALQDDLIFRPVDRERLFLGCHPGGIQQPKDLKN
jgi:hypothetical protein